MSNHQETLTKTLAEKIVKAARPDNQEETSAALAQFSEINADAAEVLATQFALRAEFPKVRSLSLAAAQALGKMNRSWIVLDGLTSLTPELAKALARGGALSLKGVKKLDKDTAKELARHKLYLHLSGVEEASDEVIEALSETKASLFLDSLQHVSNDALEKLISFREGILSLGIRQLDEKQGQIIERYRGKELWLDSVPALTDPVAGSLSLVPCFLSLKSVRQFSEAACARLARRTEGWILAGNLNLSENGFKALFPDARTGELRLAGWIELPAYAYEIIRTPRVINKWLGRRYSDADFSKEPAVLTPAGAEAIVRAGPSKVVLWLQSLPDEVAEQLQKHTGYLRIVVRDLSVSAAASLAGRKYWPKRIRESSTCQGQEWSLSLGLKSLESAQARALAETNYPLKLLPLGDLTDEAAAALALHKGDLWLGNAQADEMVYAPNELLRSDDLSPTAVKALAKKIGTINGIKPSQWVKKHRKKQKVLHVDGQGFVPEEWAQSQSVQKRFPRLSL